MIKKNWLILAMVVIVLLTGCILSKTWLTLSIEGEGMVTKTPDDNGKGYKKGAIVILEATPKDEWCFVNWSGDVTGQSRTVTVKMAKNLNIKVIFQPIIKPEGLTVSVNLQTVEITWSEGDASIAGYNIARSLTTDVNSSEILNTTLLTTTSYSDLPLEDATNWYYWLNAVDQNNNTSAWIGPVEAKKKYPLTIVINGNGTVLKTPDDYNLGYEYDTRVTLQALADNGFQFDCYTGDASGNEPEAVVVMSAAKNVTASFKSAPLLVPQKYATIQAAIDAVKEGETIMVSPGTYKENLDFKGKGGFTLTSTNPSDNETRKNTVIDGNLAGPCIKALSCSKNVVISGFTLTNGSGNIANNEAFGGALYVAGSQLTLTQNDIVNNTASAEQFAYGGALYAEHSTLVLKDNTIRNNITSAFKNQAFGGAIYIADVDLTLENNQLIDNTTTSTLSQTYGGLLYANSCKLAVKENIISGNKALGNNSWGGCLSIYNSEEVILEQNIIYINQAGNGGAIYSEYCNLTLTKNTIRENSAFLEIPRSAAYGGAIFAKGGSLTLLENTIEANVVETYFNVGASAFGGAINLNNVNLTAEKNTILSNQVHATTDEPYIAHNFGGALCADSCILSLKENIINFNEGYAAYDTYGGGVYLSNSTLDMENNHLSYNKASISGGAIYSSNSKVTMYSDTLIGNTAIWGGGLCLTNTSNLVFENNTVQSNVATAGQQNVGTPPCGGGLYIQKDSFIKNNSENILTSEQVLNTNTFINNTPDNLYFDE